jgi:hypothetical protein
MKSYIAPNASALPADKDAAPSAGLIDHGNYAAQGETAPVQMPDRREPVDVRTSRTPPVETKTSGPVKSAPGHIDYDVEEKPL